MPIARADGQNHINKMGTIDLRMRDTITYYGSIVLGLAVFGWIFVRLWNCMKQHLFRSYLLGFEVECADLAANRKIRLFEPLEKIISNDEILRSIGCMRILEIGVKTGENLQYYPGGTYFIGVDCNKKLGDYLTHGERSWQFAHVYFERFIIGDGSSLKGIPTGCVDAVVTTRSLCSTRSVKQTLREIRRVLAPDGKYFFMEHVPNNDSAFAHWLQQFLTKTRIWPLLYGDCRLDSNPIDDIEYAGFKDVTWKRFSIKGYVSQPYHLFLTRYHVVGTATR